jgi:hypothetical protein
MNATQARELELILHRGTAERRIERNGRITGLTQIGIFGGIVTSVAALFAGYTATSVFGMSLLIAGLPTAVLYGAYRTTQRNKHPEITEARNARQEFVYSLEQLFKKRNILKQRI